MVLMAPGDGRPRFFILSQESTAGKPFSLFPWRAPGTTVIIRGPGSLPDEAAEALACGVPIPPHGSIFGWAAGSAVTALVFAYARYTPQSPVPGWSVLPCLEVPRGQWPPRSYKKVLGRWFWQYVRAGAVLDLRDDIAAAPGALLWSGAAQLPDSECCAVARDVALTGGLRLPAGRYVPYQAALADVPIPALDVLLRDPSRRDLASGRSRGIGRPQIAR